MGSFWRTVPLVAAIPLAAALAWGFVEALAPAGGSAVPAVAAPSPPPKRAGQLTVLAIGDSLARGTGAAPGSGWVDDVARTLGRRQPGLRLENLGIEGLETTGLRELLSHPQPRSLAASADAILVSIGGNDLSHAVGRVRSESPLQALGSARRTFETNLDAILGELRELDPAGRIVLLLLYNPFGGSELGEAGSAVIVDWNASAQKIALSHRVAAVPTLDLFESRPDRLSRDHFHPNEEGYRLIAERVNQIF
jgi:lysophospholipase L1-like esterase